MTDKLEKDEPLSEPTEYDFGTSPYDKERLEDLPILDFETSRVLTYGTYGGVLALVFFMIDLGINQDLSKFPEPLVRTLGSNNPYALFYIFAVISLSLLTFFIARKQLKYYYGKKIEGKGKDAVFEGKGKDALFVKYIRQANPLETSLDWLLGFVGIILFLFAFFPAWWFIAMSVYSFLVALRCAITLLRPALARRLRKKGEEDIPLWFDDVRNPETLMKPKFRKGRPRGKPYRVRTVLAGWVVTHVVVSIASLALGLIFLTLFFNAIEPVRFLFFLLMFGIIAGLNFCLRERGYTFAENSIFLQKIFVFSKET